MRWRKYSKHRGNDREDRKRKIKRGTIKRERGQRWKSKEEIKKKIKCEEKNEKEIFCCRRRCWESVKLLQRWQDRETVKRLCLCHRDRRMLLWLLCVLIRLTKSEREIMICPQREPNSCEAFNSLTINIAFTIQVNVQAVAFTSWRQKIRFNINVCYLMPGGNTFLLSSRV